MPTMCNNCGIMTEDRCNIFVYQAVHVIKIYTWWFDFIARVWYWFEPCCNKIIGGNIYIYWYDTPPRWDSAGADTYLTFRKDLFVKP